MKTSIKKGAKIVQRQAIIPPPKKQANPNPADPEKWTLKRILLAVVCAFFFPLIYWIGKSIVAWLG